MARQEDTTLWKLLDGSPKEWFWFLGGLAGLAAVLWAFVRFVAWMRDDEDTAAAEQMMLTEIGEMHRGGDLSQEEYRSIKGRLLERLEDSVGSAEQPDSKQDGVSDENQDEVQQGGAE